MEKYNRF